MNELLALNQFVDQKRNEKNSVIGEEDLLFDIQEEKKERTFVNTANDNDYADPKFTFGD